MMGKIPVTLNSYDIAVKIRCCLDEERTEEEKFLLSASDPK